MRTGGEHAHGVHHEVRDLLHVAGLRPPGQLIRNLVRDARDVVGDDEDKGEVGHVDRHLLCDKPHVHEEGEHCNRITSHHELNLMFLPLITPQPNCNECGKTFPDLLSCGFSHGMFEPRLARCVNRVGEVLGWPTVKAQNTGQPPGGCVQDDVDHGVDAEKAVQVEVPLDEASCATEESGEPSSWGKICLVQMQCCGAPAGGSAYKAANMGARNGRQTTNKFAMLLNLPTRVRRALTEMTFSFATVRTNSCASSNNYCLILTLTPGGECMI